MQLTAINVSHAGLGNRMRFTLSAASVARAVTREFRFVWPRGEAFSCPPDELWTNLPGGEVPQSEVPPDAENKDLVDWANVGGTDWASLEAENIFVKGAGVLARPAGALTWGELLQGLEPSPRVRVGVDQTWRRISPEAGILGVSIRSSPKTHAKTLAASPVSWYEAQVREFLSKNPEVPVFLSADQREVEQRLQQEFSQIVIQDKSGGYNSPQGVREAVVDLYILASCSYLLTPYWSSFPVMAQELSGGAAPMRDARRTDPGNSASTLTVAVDPLDPRGSRQPVADWRQWSDTPSTGCPTGLGDCATRYSDR